MDKQRILKRATLILLALYLVTQAWRGLTPSPDPAIQSIVMRYAQIGDCFDGDYQDYYILQSIYAPRILDYATEGCPQAAADTGAVRRPLLAR